jgi:two-component system, NtrC family, sensor kinase
MLAMRPGSMTARASHLPRMRGSYKVWAKRPWPLAAWMLVAIAIVTGLAWWDERREAAAALHELGTEQSIIASSYANSLQAYLAAVVRDAVLIGEHGPAAPWGNYTPAVVRADNKPRTLDVNPSRIVLSIPLVDGRIVDLGVAAGDLLQRHPPIDHEGELRVLVAPPRDAALYSTAGVLLSSPALRDALDRNASTLQLSRTEAAKLGLVARTAFAGLAHVDAGPLGRWGVVAVATAARERDRETRALWRLLLSVVVASGLVLVFGGAALRKQRKELELASELAVAQVQRERDEELVRSARIATLGTLAMGIAHEVSTPLGVIVGRAEQLLARVKDDERAARSARLILEQADRIQLIVRRFLDLARGGRPSLGRTDPSDVVRSAASSVEHRFAEAKVSLTTDVPAEMPFIQCDRSLLEHAIVNLLLNACEACEPGRHVDLAARSDTQRVAFVVSDDGSGITPENATRATEPFFTTKPAGSGTGLGLAIAAEIAKSHRGELTIAANVESGTRACIEIPIAAPGGLHG